jgi:diadenosine tetraphosphate (Ap4A) HIT family hydrolase
MTNATLRKFGYPNSLIRDYDHWCVLLRPAQVTLGSLVLGAKSEAQSFAALPQQAFTELATITSHIEASLKSFRVFDKINYLMLMMVDPQVHFHVLPRYQAAQSFDGAMFPDKGWPAAPDLGSAITPAPEVAARLLAELKRCWPKD